MVTTGVTLAVLGACGYGAWMMYKKNHPEAVYQMKKEMNKALKGAEQRMENMM